MYRIIAAAGLALAVSATATLAADAAPVAPAADADAVAVAVAGAPVAAVGFKPKFLRVGAAVLPAPIPVAEAAAGEPSVISYLIDGGVEEPRGGNPITSALRGIDG